MKPEARGTWLESNKCCGLEISQQKRVLLSLTQADERQVCTWSYVGKGRTTDGRSTEDLSVWLGEWLYPR